VFDALVQTPFLTVPRTQQDESHQITLRDGKRHQIKLFKQTYIVASVLYSGGKLKAVVRDGNLQRTCKETLCVLRGCLCAIVITTNIRHLLPRVGRPALLLVHVVCSVSKDHIRRAIKCPVVVQIPHIPEINCSNTPT
jgi:hypothetical protein